MSFNFLPVWLPSIDDIKDGLSVVSRLTTGTITSDSALGATVRSLVGSDVTHWADTMEAQRDADTERLGLGIGTGIGTVGESSVVMDSFASMTHEEMVARTDAISAASIDTIALAWSGAADMLLPAIDTFRSTITSAIESGWEGTAANAASDGVRAASDNLGGLADSARTVADKLDAARIGLEETRRMMPPVGGSNGIISDIAANVGLGFLVKRAMYDDSEQRAEAVAVLENVYAPTVQQADRTLPEFRSAADPTTGTLSTTGSGSAATDSATGGFTGVPVTDAARTVTGAPGAVGSNGDQADSVATDGETPGTAGASDTTSGAGETPGTSADSDAYRSWTSPAATTGDTYTTPATAAGFGSGTSNAATSIPTSSGSGAHAATSGTGGYASGGNTSGIGSFGGTGGAVGVPGTASVSAGGALTGSGAATAGRPGATGMGMMPGAGRGAGGHDNDSEHSTPGYLVNADNGSDLVGDLPLVAPPVLGT